MLMRKSSLYNIGTFRLRKNKKRFYSGVTDHKNIVNYYKKKYEKKNQNCH